MQASSIRILLVEDDATLGAAAQEALARSGFQVQWVKSADEAKSAFKFKVFNLVIIDCLLPKTNGVDLAKGLRNEFGSGFQLILMSGIYRDKLFAKDAIKKVSAADFLVKPFQLSELLAKVNEVLSAELEPQLDSLSNLFLQEQVTKQEKIKAIEQAGVVQGFDLLWVYSIISSTRLTGALTITPNDGDPSRVDFKDGQIVHVHFKDARSFFGVLLVENGFTTPEEVEAVLADSGGKPIGEALVANHSLSPHAIRLVQVQQMAIRLSQIISDASVRLHFAETQVEESEVVVTQDELIPLLADWIVSKINPLWLKGFFVIWQEYKLKPGPNWKLLKNLRGHRILKDCQRLADLVDARPQLFHVLNQPGSEAQTARAIYFMLVSQIIGFETKTGGQVNFDEQKTRFEKLAKEYAQMNHFEVLGLGRDARGTEIQKAYHELAKVLHPDLIAKNAPKDVHALAAKVFARISAAYETLSNPVSLEAYRIELSHGRAEDAMQAEKVFEAAIRDLQNSRYSEAYLQLTKIRPEHLGRGDFNIYLAWSAIKVWGGEARRPEKIDQVEAWLDEVPPETRHTAAFVFVRGLVARLKKAYPQAAQHFQQSISIDPSFLPAKRELLKLAAKSKAEKQKSILHADITEVVGTFFGRRKAG